MNLEIKRFKDNHFRVYGKLFFYEFNETKKVIVDGESYSRKINAAWGYGEIDDDYYDKFKEENIKFFDGKDWIDERPNDDVKDIDFGYSSNQLASMYQIRMRPRTMECDWLSPMGIDIKIECPSGYKFTDIGGSGNEYIKVFTHIVDEFYFKDGKYHYGVFTSNSHKDYYDKPTIDEVILPVDEYGFNNTVYLSLPFNEFMQLDFTKISHIPFWSNDRYGDFNFSRYKRKWQDITEDDKLEISLAFVNKLVAA